MYDIHSPDEVIIRNPANSRPKIAGSVPIGVHERILEELPEHWASVKITSLV
jgi:hypothetical protein